MSSLMRSSAIRRALSSVSSGGPNGAPFSRAPLAARVASKGGDGTTVRRGLVLPTMPRRHLCSSGSTSPLNGAPAHPSSGEHNSEQVNALLEDMKRLKLTLNKGFIVAGGIKLLVEESKPRSSFAQWAWPLGACTFVCFVGRWTKSDNGQSQLSEDN